MKNYKKENIKIRGLWGSKYVNFWGRNLNDFFYSFHFLEFIFQWQHIDTFAFSIFIIDGLSNGKNTLCCWINWKFLFNITHFNKRISTLFHSDCNFFFPIFKNKNNIIFNPSSNFNVIWCNSNFPTTYNFFFLFFG